MAIELETFSFKRHGKFHHPEINGVSTVTERYLTLPFFSDVGSYQITEGWMYSRAEKAIHGYRIHGAVDFQVPYGTPVTAPCDGIAISSYHSFPLKDSDRNIKKLEGKELYFGLGYFVQIYVEHLNRYVQLGHLSKIDETIPFSMPKLEEGTWNPTNHDFNPSNLIDSGKAVLVKRGDLLGKVGFSGLRLGYDEYNGEERPLLLDTLKFKSYDEPHLHFEETGRDEKGKKGWQRDPYDIYLTARNYPTPSRQRIMGEEPLFILGENGLLIFANQVLN